MVIKCARHMSSKDKLFYSRTGRETEQIFVTKVRDLIKNHHHNFSYIGRNIAAQYNKIRNNRTDQRGLENCFRLVCIMCENKTCLKIRMNITGM
jgi:hypothetical protein